MSIVNSRLLAPAVLLSSLLSGCAATNPNILKAYDASTSSRIRIFVYSADRIRLDFDRTCYTDPGMFGHGEGLETAQRSHHQGSRSVGMPPTSKRSEAVFDEYIIKAGLPVTVFGKVGGTYNSSWTGVSSYRRETKDAGHFVPVAGKDYEIYVQDRKLIVEDVSAGTASGATKLLDLTPASACTPERSPQSQG